MRGYFTETVRDFSTPLEMTNSAGRRWVEYRIGFACGSTLNVQRSTFNDKFKIALANLLLRN
jgi:hypothetical protein